MPPQKPNVKKAPPSQSLFQDFREIGTNVKRQLLIWAKQFEKFRDIIKNNYNLGLMHLSQGNLQDAILRFKFVVWLEPKYGDAWYQLGRSYLANGNKNAARDAFRKAQKLKNNAGAEETAYMLAIAMGRSTPVNELPKKIPLELVREHFDILAPQFNQEQLETLKYEGHTLVANSLRSYLVPGRIDHLILDLGVGTGLCGPLLRDVAAHITGVDISNAMLAEAMKLHDGQGKKIYDALIKREAVEFMGDSPASAYDIVMAAGLVSYIGDLQDFMRKAAHVLKPGGILIFTADKKEVIDYQFDPEAGRFGFAQGYLEPLGENSELNLLRCKDGNVYPGYPAWICVFRK